MISRRALLLAAPALMATTSLVPPAAARENTGLPDEYRRLLAWSYCERCGLRSPLYGLTLEHIENSGIIRVHHECAEDIWRGVVYAKKMPQMYGSHGL